MNKTNKTNEMKQLVETLADYSNDPLGFVCFAFPWGSGALKDRPGPDKWQRKILSDIGNGLATVDDVIRESVASGNGVGKGNTLSTNIDTPDGVKRWGDLKVGDYVFGADGKPTRIIQTHPVYTLPTYRVTFDDDSYCDVSGEHLWTTKNRNDRRTGHDWRTISTADILRAGVRRKSGSNQHARHWIIPTQKPVEYNQVQVPIHPYLMGVWIGDGTIGKPEYAKPYLEILDKIKLLGYNAKMESDNQRVRIRNATSLFTGGVFDCHSSERYIPNNYKYNDIESRKQLLCGLLDTDGEVTNHHSIGYSTTSKQLADDVIWMVRSLGGKAQMQPTIKTGWYYKDGEKKICNDCYRVTMTLNFNPFTIKHRKERYKPDIQERYRTRFISDIAPIGIKDGMCITVESPDGLYLANDFIVTHNSCLVSWLILWSISTYADTRGVVTANTETQLRTKTWPELAKWYSLFIGKDLFTFTATSLFSSQRNHDKTWRIDAIPWSESNYEAFAGMHNQGRRLILIFDEASAIPDIIWETAEGALTDKDTQIIWAAFGNPTRNTGRFFECFHRHRNIWSGYQVDSRDVEISNKKQLDIWVNQYGIDSDFVKIHVLGQFPNSSENQFISMELAENGRGKHLRTEQYNFAPVIIGVDPSWTGTDPTSIMLRQGLMSKELSNIPKNDNDFVIAQLIAQFEDEYHADAVLIDMGYGTGIYSAGITMGRHWQLVAFGEKSPKIGFLNMRAFIWNEMKEWLKMGGAYPDDQQLYDDLIGPECKPRADGVIQLESKIEMKKRGLASPNKGDALAITFARNIQKKDGLIIPDKNGLYFANNGNRYKGYHNL